MSEESVKQSERFNKPGADITFKSSDNVVFALHKKNLESLANGFPPSDDKIESGVIDLPEDSETLELLFQFVYTTDDAPDLSDISVALLLKVSYAAEKYAVHFAIPLCKMRLLHDVRSYNRPVNMKGFSDSPAKIKMLKSIIRFSTFHVGYMKILDEAAPLLAVSIPLVSSLALFPASQQIGWAVYRDQWVGYHDKFQYHISDGNCSTCRKQCEPFGSHFLSVIDKPTTCGEFKNIRKNIRSYKSICEEGIEPRATCDNSELSSPGI